MAQKYHVPFLDFPIKKIVLFKKETKFHPVLGGYKNNQIDENYNPLDLLAKVVSESDGDVIPMIISHAGYIDKYMIDHSSLIIPRVKEAAAWMSQEAKNCIIKNNVQLVRYSERK